MSCNNSQRMPNSTGELKVWNEDESITTISLGPEDLWMLRTLVKDGLNRARNEHGWVNGAAKAAIIALAEKLSQLEPGCGQSCGCSH